MFLAVIKKKRQDFNSHYLKKNKKPTKPKPQYFNIEEAV